MNHVVGGLLPSSSGFLTTCRSFPGQDTDPQTLGAGKRGSLSKYPFLLYSIYTPCPFLIRFFGYGGINLLSQVIAKLRNVSSDFYRSSTPIFVLDPSRFFKLRSYFFDYCVFNIWTFVFDHAMVWSFSSCVLRPSTFWINHSGACSGLIWSSS